jgi:hypothetical protein
MTRLTLVRRIVAQPSIVFMRSGHLGRCFLVGSGRRSRVADRDRSPSAAASRCACSTARSVTAAAARR